MWVFSCDVLNGGGQKEGGVRPLIVLLRWRRVEKKHIYRVNKRIRNSWLNPNSSFMKKDSWSVGKKA